MEKDELIETMKDYWPDWDNGSHEGVVDDAIGLLGMVSFDSFSKMGWQEQDSIINTLKAIKGD